MEQPPDQCPPQDQSFLIHKLHEHYQYMLQLYHSQLQINHQQRRQLQQLQLRLQLQQENQMTRSQPVTGGGGGEIPTRPPKKCFATRLCEVIRKGDNQQFEHMILDNSFYRISYLNSTDADLTTPLITAVKSNNLLLLKALLKAGLYIITPQNSSILFIKRNYRSLCKQVG